MRKVIIFVLFVLLFVACAKKETGYLGKIDEVEVLAGRGFSCHRYILTTDDGKVHTAHMHQNSPAVGQDLYYTENFWSGMDYGYSCK